MLYASQEGYHKMCKKSRFLFHVISISYDVFQSIFLKIYVLMMAYSYEQGKGLRQIFTFFVKNALRDDQDQIFDDFGSKRLR